MQCAVVVTPASPTSSLKVIRHGFTLILLLPSFFFLFQVCPLDTGFMNPSTPQHQHIWSRAHVRKATAPSSSFPMSNARIQTCNSASAGKQHRDDLNMAYQYVAVRSEKCRQRYDYQMVIYRSTCADAQTHLHFLKHTIAEVYRYQLHVHSGTIAVDAKAALRLFFIALSTHVETLMLRSTTSKSDAYPECVRLLAVLHVYSPEVIQRAISAERECAVPSAYEGYFTDVLQR